MIFVTNCCWNAFFWPPLVATKLHLILELENGDLTVIGRKACLLDRMFVDSKTWKKSSKSQITVIYHDPWRWYCARGSAGQKHSSFCVVKDLLRKWFSIIREVDAPRTETESRKSWDLFIVVQVFVKPWVKNELPRDDYISKTVLLHGS